MKVINENPTFKFLINSTLDDSFFLLTTGEFRWIRYNSFSLQAQRLLEKK